MAGAKIRPEFAYYQLNADGRQAAERIASLFNSLLEELEHMNGRDGFPHEMRVVREKLEEACFFAKKAMSTQPKYQQKA